MSKHETNTPVHESHKTQTSRTGEPNMVNRKPYRTKAQKEEARRTARRDSDGAWRSNAPVSYHTKAQSN